MSILKQFLYNQLITIRYSLGKTKLYFLGKKKSVIHILKDLVIWQIREHEFNDLFYAFGLGIKGSQQKKYIGKRTILKIKNKIENKLKEKAGCDNFEYDVITKDKFYANSVFSANGISCFLNLALISGSIMIFPDGKQEKITSILNLHENFFLKNNVLEAGEGIYKCRIVKNNVEINGELKDWDTFVATLGNKIWVLQKQYSSHEALRKVNSTALNTTRIVTILNGKEPEYLCGFQGFATNNALTDSWSNRSIYVGIDIDKECLKEIGFTSPFDLRTGLHFSHPDSGIKFQGYKIPYIKEAVELCQKAHKLLYFNFLIGWDVAITDEGPMIVEANEKPGMNVAQCVDGGLREKITKYASQILKMK